MAGTLPAFEGIRLVRERLVGDDIQLRMAPADDTTLRDLT